MGSTESEMSLEATTWSAGANRQQKEGAESGRKVRKFFRQKFLGGEIFGTTNFGTLRECLPNADPASKSMFQPSIPTLYPRHTELGAPFSQLQKHKSTMHGWKKWWRGSVMTTLTFLGIIAGSLGHENKCPNPTVPGEVGKSHTDTCAQTVGGGTVTVETLPSAAGTPTLPL